MPRAIETVGCARVPAPAMLPRLADTNTHCATTPSVPSQLSSANAGSIGSASEILLHAYSQPHAPVAGFPSRSHVPAGHVVPHWRPSLEPSPPGDPSMPPSGAPPPSPPVPDTPPVPDIPRLPPAPDPPCPPVPATGVTSPQAAALTHKQIVKKAVA